MRKRIGICFSVVVCLFAAVLSVSCAKKTAVHFSRPDSSAVEECTFAFLGRLEPVKITLKNPLPAAVENGAHFSESIALVPPVSGTVVKTGDYSVEFRPSKPYKSGLLYTVCVDTGILAGEKPAVRGFTYKISAADPDFVFTPEGLTSERSADGEHLAFSAKLTSDVPYPLKTFEKMVSVTLGGQPLPVIWQEDSAEAAGTETAVRAFSVPRLERTAQARYLTVTVDGGPISSARRETKTWLVPASDAFEVVEINTEDTSCFWVKFSDRLDSKQDIRGFVRSPSVTAQNIRYDIDGNTLRLYASKNWQPDARVEILDGIKSENGKVLKIPVAATRNITWEKPSVSFLSKGVILPSSQGVKLPLETINVSGVIVQVYQIQSGNMLQFLQVNDLNGTSELVRVAAPVWTKEFDLGWSDDNANKRLRHGLELTELVKKFPGGMYQIRVTFRKRHAHYECPSDHAFANLAFPSDDIPFSQTIHPDTSEEDEDSYWDYYGSGSAYRDYYSFRNDPCHPAYYMDYYNRSITKMQNVLVSNIGVTAKTSADGGLYVTLADIGTTKPVSGADVRIYTYSQKELAASATDANGFALFKIPLAGLPQKTIGKPGDNALPYFIRAEKNGQTTVMRIDSGTALSTSHFEVDGENVISGTKGFIYGERGVWRPGDTLYLGFILQGKDGPLPAGFPVRFELQNPRGLVTQTQTLTNGVGGFYRVDAKTAADDPTGNWTARFTAGGRTWSKTVKVETVVPNRLFVTLTTDQTSLKARRNAFTLAGSWLHGAAAPYLDADVSAAFYESSAGFSGYTDYTFRDPSRSVQYRMEKIWEGSLGSDSKAQFTVDMPAESELPGKLKAQMLSRIFEPSGAFSAEQAVFDFSPYERYVGLKLPKGDAARNMLLTDTDHQADIIVLDEQGVPVKNETAISMSLYKLDWRWWWEKDAYQDVTSYASGRSYRALLNDTVKVKNGRASWKFRINYPDWGRYLVVARDTADGHAAAQVVYIDWPGWAGRSQESGSGSAAMVVLTADKQTYAPGDTAQISFTAASASRALITIEKGGAVVARDWLEISSAGTAAYKLKITENMAPNVYVHVSLLQQHLQTANDLPVRQYGIVSLKVESPSTRLNPVIKTAETYESGQSAQITVSERNGKPMTFTLAVVDEGLLGLTAFKTANPWNEFFKKEASLLRSWDIYNYVMNAYSGQLQTLLTVGGSESGAAAGSKDAQRFKPVVQYYGPFTLAAGASKTVDFNAGSYIGAVRAMVVAADVQKSAFGIAEQSVPVKSALMTQTALPRTIGLGETLDIPVTVFTDAGSQNSVSVTVRAEGSLRIDQNGRQFETYTFTRRLGGADTVLYFGVRAVTRGEGKLTIKSEVADGTQTRSFTETVSVLSELRGTLTRNTAAEQIEGGRKKTVSVASRGESGSKSLYVEISPQPVLDLESRLSFLTGYPHGCIEQITSGGFPQLYLNTVMNLNAERASSVQANVQSVIDRYPLYQTLSGGFAYWSGGSSPHAWGSNYAGHFMIEARKAGYAVPSSLFDPWLSYQRKQAADWSPNSGDDERIQAYRLYTLALAGSSDIGSMNRLRSVNSLPATATYYLAAAYYLAGQRQEATRLIEKTDTAVRAYRESGDTFGSDLRDTAIILQCLSVMNEQRKTLPLIKKIAETLGSDKWISTQEAGYCLMALAPYYSVSVDGNVSYSFVWRGKTYAGVLTKNVETIQLPDSASPTADINFENTGKKPLYVKAVATGMLKPGDERAVSSSLSLSYRLERDGRTVAPAALAKGDSVKILVRVNNTSGRALQNIALTVPLASGWEIVNTRLGSESDYYADSAESSYTYRDIRDTVAYTYFDMERGEAKNFSFDAVITHSGSYYLPAVKAEAMYDDTVNAVSPGAMLTIAAR